MVREGRFREDLFFRLNVVRIDVPPLRDRPEDILLLAHFFLEKFKTRYQKITETLDPKVLVALESYGWPGNVRELENVIQHLVVVSDGQVIGPKSLPAKLRNVTAIDGEEDPSYLRMDFSSARKMVLDHFTRNYLVKLRS